MMRYGLVLALLGLTAIAGATEAPQKPAAPQSDKAIDPDADRLLRQMSDYLAGLKSFQVMASSVDQILTTDGRKLQVTGDHQVFVERPNRMRSQEVAAASGLAGNRLELWDDGKTMTLFCKANNTFASVSAPPSIDAAVDALHDQYHVDAPAADLLQSNAYEVLTEQVTGGQVIGKEPVDGVLANHLAFRGEEVDWQIWIQDGPQPLPLRYVITSKTMRDKPEFAVQLSRWQTQAKLSDSTFEFHAPPGAKRVTTVPTSCTAPQ